MIEYCLIIPAGYFFYYYFSEDEFEKVVDGRRFPGEKDFKIERDK